MLCEAARELNRVLLLPFNVCERPPRARRHAHSRWSPFILFKSLYNYRKALQLYLGIKVFDSCLCRVVICYRRGVKSHGGSSKGYRQDGVEILAMQMQISQTHVIF